MKKENQVGGTEFYKHYKSQTLTDPVYDISAQKYRSILLDLNRMLSYHITHSGLEYKMAARMGFLKIVKKKIRIQLHPETGKLDTRYLKPDWKATKELWANDSLAKEQKKLVYHTNKHTNGYYYRWYWDKRTSTAVNQLYYKFEACRYNERLISKAVKSGHLIDAYES